MPDYIESKDLDALTAHIQDKRLFDFTAPTPSRGLKVQVKEALTALNAVDLAAFQRDSVVNVRYGGLDPMDKVGVKMALEKWRNSIPTARMSEVNNPAYLPPNGLQIVYQDK
jgi:hypothetical protein